MQGGVEGWNRSAEMRAALSPLRGLLFLHLITHGSRRGLHSYAASRLERKLTAHSSGDAVFVLRWKRCATQRPTFRPNSAFAFYYDPEFSQLGVADRRWRIHHQIHGAGGFGEGNYFAQAFGSGEDHDDAVETKGDATVRGRAGLEGFEKKSEAGAGFFFGHAEGAEDSALHILAVNADGARAQFGAVQHDVIGQRAHGAQRRLRVVQGFDAAFELGHVFFVRRSEGMVRGVPGLLTFVPFEHGEICDPEKA